MYRIPSRRGIPQITHRAIPQHRKYAKDVPQPVVPSSPDVESTAEVFSSKAKASTSSMLNDHVGIPRQTFATEPLPRSPPPSSEPVVETFESTSKPKPYYARPPPRTDLPLQKVCPFHDIALLFLSTLFQKPWPLITSFVAAGVLGWAAFFSVVTNQEKLSSSVVRQIIRTVKDSEDLKEMLGEAIRPQPEWWLNGDPWIEGAVSTLALGHFIY